MFLQTGDVPPSDFNFENMKDPQALLSQDALEETRPSNLNLYPRKRELEAEISAANEELARSKSFNPYCFILLKCKLLYIMSICN